MGSGSRSMTGPAAIKFALGKLRPKLEPRVEKLGLAWEDALAAFECVDSMEELQEAAEDPGAYTR